MDKPRAQFGRILYKRRLHLWAYAHVKDFLCIYSSSVEPEYVLKPNVSLYSLSKEEAVFVETEGDINIYSSDVSPFLNLVQFDYSINVIKMPIDSFHALAEKVGDPSVPVIWISNTFRCGGTILAQIFEKIPGTLLVSEPEAPTNIGLIDKFQTISGDEREKLIRSHLRLMCKPHPGTNMICIKPRGVCISIMKDLSLIVPYVKHIFIYRNCMETVSSMLALMSAVSYSEFGRICMDTEFTLAKPHFRKESEKHFIRKPIESHPTKIRYNNATEMFTYMWANYMFVARDAISRDGSILPIKYEDMVSEKVKVCSMIFEKLGIDPIHLSASLTAFDRDSQRGTVVSRNVVGNTPRRVISKENRIKADVILTSYGLPRMGDDFRL